MPISTSAQADDERLFGGDPARRAVRQHEADLVHGLRGALQDRLGAQHAVGEILVGGVDGGRQGEGRRTARWGRSRSPPACSSTRSATIASSRSRASASITTPATTCSTMPPTRTFSATRTAMSPFPTARAWASRSTKSMSRSAPRKAIAGSIRSGATRTAPSQSGEEIRSPVSAGQLFLCNR